MVNEPPAAAPAPGRRATGGPTGRTTVGGRTAQPKSHSRSSAAGPSARTSSPCAYRKLTDADLGVILFKFVLPDGQNTLPVDIKAILDVHKHYPNSGEPTGLHFEDSRKHGKVWVIRNDTEGRDVAAKIDIALQKLAPRNMTSSRTGSHREWPRAMTTPPLQFSVPPGYCRHRPRLPIPREPVCDGEVPGASTGTQRPFGLQQNQARPLAPGAASVSTRKSRSLRFPSPLGPRREDQVSGEDYDFQPEADFAALLVVSQLLEHTELYGYLL